MLISHDGDRIYRFTLDLEKMPYNSEYAYLEGFLDIARIPGGYRCSIPEIDFIVDVAKYDDNVLGAQICGGGLGGCAMVWAKANYSKQIQDKITNHYKQYFNKECSVYNCKPVNGCSVYKL